MTYDYFAHRPAVYMVVAIAMLISLGDIAALLIGAAAGMGEAALC